MFGRRKNKPAGTSHSNMRVAIETLERRQLLSSYGNLVFQPVVLEHPSATTAAESGFSPSEVSKAYQFDQIKLSNSNGSVTADGSGQTIAIVDAYNDPNIVGDLKTFDTQFGLSAPSSLQIVSQTGSTSKLPSTDAGWAGEISLDVEWAHALAPGANILLVEADSASLSDLMTAINYARHASGVSTISMSWGGSEFFSWSNGEFSGQTQYDPYFTTPTGHQGITFVAAAGDSGSFSGVEWPASSPNVLSVGGTSLFTNNDGSYNTESSWSGTSGGYSQIESKPAYQNIVQTSTFRSTPDVALVGDPNTGVAVYDSLAFQGFSGWQQVGGTSAGAPQWAGLIAIADQGRALAGLGTLDGATQTLPILYSLYTVNTYDSNFNDVIDAGSSNPWHWRWGVGFSGNQATQGYDTATGLGSPKAGALVAALVSGSTSSSGSSGSGSSPGAGSGTSTPAQLPASPLQGRFLNSPPDSVLDGSSGSVRLQITNTIRSAFAGPVTVKLYASANGSATSSDTLLTTLTIPHLVLKGLASKTVTLHYTYPSNISSGEYFVTASIDATRTNTADAIVSTAKAITIAPPQVDLAAGFLNNAAIFVSPGVTNTAIVTVQNQGNVTASGTLNVSLYLSSDNTIDNTSTLVATLPSQKIHLKAGGTLGFRMRFTPTVDQLATFNVIAKITSNTTPADTNSSNDIAVAQTF